MAYVDNVEFFSIYIENVNKQVQLIFNSIVYLTKYIQDIISTCY